ncbi:hypothetical protein RND71_023263 [Anisodus tanguticus]|uniref:Uncharacterized protein n=1 Tax=Anisodus tanguticus TaxID=243964 RepID=A0AAE1V5W9_9SOLA|nr:hypothetical protein RND71_023263 [Anisodus tanguticus]
MDANIELQQLKSCINQRRMFVCFSCFKKICGSFFFLVALLNELWYIVVSISVECFNQMLKS